MRTTNLIYNGHAELAAALEARGVQDGPGVLVQVFSGIAQPEHIRGVIQALGTALPRATICGATTGGEMVGGRALEHSTVLSICEFEDTRLACTAVPARGLDPRRLGRRVCERLGAPGARLLISFATGLDTNGEEYTRGIDAVCGDVVLAGGFAGDNRRFRNTLVFTRDAVLEHGAVAVALFNDRLRVHSHYSLDWMALGRPMEITRACANRVYTIDGQPALDVYRRYLGRDVSRRMPVLGVQFPLIVERRGTTVARTCSAVEADGSLIYMGNLAEGERVRFALGNPNSVVHSLQRTHGALSRQPAEAIFVYSSMARKRMMKHSAGLEAHYLQTVAPTAGFFTYGEFFHLSGGSEFFNYTMTTVALSEHAPVTTPAQEPVQPPAASDTHLELRALSNLVDITSRELEHINQSLEHLATTDPLTGTLNRRKLNDLIQGELIRRRRYGRRATLIMFDLDDFKDINDTHGHDMGDLVIKTVSDTIQSAIRNTDYLGRWGGEEFLILCTETAEREAQGLAERLRQAIETHYTPDNIPVTVSVGVTEIRPEDRIETLLRRADQALYRAKHEGKNRVCVNA